MKIIGLTGGIGSGKSFVAEMFRDLGIPVYDSDVAAKQLMNTSKELKQNIIELFGDEAYNQNGLNRPFLAARVFKDSEVLHKLNEIVHPAVKKDFYAWCEKQKAPYIVQETALIFENQMEQRYDAIILVTAPKELRIERVVQRGDQTKEQVLSRMENQLKDSEKKKKSHYIIENTSADNTKLQVLHIHDQILADLEGL